MQWIYGLFLDLMSYCANALLGVMSTDLSFFETSVPIVPDLYKIFVAIGWGLLIGNCAFQCMKAMFAGLGFETESPAILLMRTFLFGFLLIFSCFSKEYIETSGEFAPFTMQKLYDISIVDYTYSAVAPSGYTSVRVYGLRYKIKDNNGSLRDDIGSDGEIEQRVSVVKDANGNAFIYGINVLRS